LHPNQNPGYPVRGLDRINIFKWFSAFDRINLAAAEMKISIFTIALANQQRRPYSLLLLM